MHEFSVAQTIVDSVCIELKRISKPNLRLVTTHVVVGRLRAIIPDFLQSAYESIAQETPAKGSKLEVVFAPLNGTCLACGWTGELTTAFFECPTCASRQGRLNGGRELYLQNLEIEHD
jgi:hydrogenase nickel insertion protein HypA